MNTNPTQDSAALPRMACSSAICGNCGKAFSDHYHEFGEDYCYLETTGDLFTSEPSTDLLLGMFTDEQIEEAKQRWRTTNGHCLTNDLVEAPKTKR